MSQHHQKDKMQRKRESKTKKRFTFQSKLTTWNPHGTHSIGEWASFYWCRSWTQHVAIGVSQWMPKSPDPKRQNMQSEAGEVESVLTCY